LFKPQVCGLHTVYAVAGEGTRHEHSATFKPIAVQCPDSAKLSALVSGKTGTQTARKWILTVSNTGSGAAQNAQINGLSLTQTYGAKCTPVVAGPASFPLGIGNIAAGNSASGDVTINFAGCAPMARFRADLAFSSNNGIVPGSATFNNQFR